MVLLRVVFKDQRESPPATLSIGIGSLLQLVDLLFIFLSHNLLALSVLTLLLNPALKFKV
jgi:hypothetical protein